MVRISLSLSIVLFSGFTILAQCPTQPFDLLNQAEVNAFPGNYPSCTFLPDGVDVKISGNDITDLSPLSQLTGTLAVFEIRDCPNLVSLTGMDNFTVIGNDALDGFILRDLPSLNSIASLSTLDSVTGEFTIRTCPQLASLNGLDNLVYANGSLIIRDNAILISLQGLNNLEYIGETLELVENPTLTDISALSNVDTIVGGIEGGVFLEANTALTTLNGLGHANTSIGSNLDLLFNDNLSLCSVPSICTYLSNPPQGAVITISANALGCNSQQEIESGCANLSLSEISTSAQLFALLGNPVSEKLVIETNFSGTMELFSAHNFIGSYSLEPGIHTLDVRHLKAGVYFLRAASGKTLKWVKN